MVFLKLSTYGEGSFINRKNQQLILGKNVKLFAFLVIFSSVLTFGCSFIPMQKAGTDALLEAHCLYEKKFNYKSDNFKKGLSDQNR